MVLLPLASCEALKHLSTALLERNYLLQWSAQQCTQSLVLSLPKLSPCLLDEASDSNQKVDGKGQIR